MKRLQFLRGVWFLLALGLAFGGVIPFMSAARADAILPPNWPPPDPEPETGPDEEKSAETPKNLAVGLSAATSLALFGLWAARGFRRPQVVNGNLQPAGGQPA